MSRYRKVNWDKPLSLPPYLSMYVTDNSNQYLATLPWLYCPQFCIFNSEELEICPSFTEYSPQSCSQTSLESQRLASISGTVIIDHFNARFSLTLKPRKEGSSSRHPPPPPRAWAVERARCVRSVLRAPAAEDLPTVRLTRHSNTDTWDIIRYELELMHDV